MLIHNSDVASVFNQIANLPPQMGIIALLAGLVCYSLIGSSRFAIISATSSSAAVLAAAIASVINLILKCAAAFGLFPAR